VVLDRCACFVCGLPSCRSTHIAAQSWRDSVSEPDSTINLGGNSYIPLSDNADAASDECVGSSAAYGDADTNAGAPFSHSST
jgi:hypothetical protein